MPTMKYISKNWTNYSDSKNLYDMNQMELKAELDVQIMKIAVLAVEREEHNVKHTYGSIVINETRKKLTEPMKQLFVERKRVRAQWIKDLGNFNESDADIEKRMGISMLDLKKQVVVMDAEVMADGLVFYEQHLKVLNHKKSHERYMTQWNKHIKNINVCIDALNSLIYI
jgi:hypothetical protein